MEVDHQILLTYIYS